MKKQFFMIALFITMINYGQYSRSSMGVSAGITKIQDRTPFQKFNTQLYFRHMANTKFGGEFRVGYSRLYEGSDDLKYETPISYSTGTLHGVVNVGRVLNFESFTKNYTILAGLGGTYIYSNGSTVDEVIVNVLREQDSFTGEDLVEVNCHGGILVGAKPPFRDQEARPLLPRLPGKV